MARSSILDEDVEMDNLRKVSEDEGDKDDLLMEEDTSNAICGAEEAAHRDSIDIGDMKRDMCCNNCRRK